MPKITGFVRQTYLIWFPIFVPKFETPVRKPVLELVRDLQLILSLELVRPYRHLVRQKPRPLYQSDIRLYQDQKDYLAILDYLEMQHHQTHSRHRH